MAIGLLYRAIIEVAREAGVDVEGLLRKLGYTEQQLLDPATRLSPEEGRKLARLLTARVRDPALGLRAAERLRPADADLVGYLLQNAAHPLDALDQFARFARLLGDTAACTIERKSGRVTIVLGLTDGRRMVPEGADYYTAGVFKFVRELVPGIALPLHVNVARPRPSRPATWEQFFGCPVSFGGRSCQLVYDEARLVTKTTGSDPRLAALLEREAHRALEELPPDGDVVQRVHAHIERRLETGEYALPHVAVALGMSERTLRRRLRDAGLSYRALLDEVRRDVALALVEKEQGNLTAIAQRVGFADTTAFARAFRRWTGSAPQAFRRR